MATSYSGHEWKRFLPAAYDWLDQVKIGWSEVSAGCVYNIVAVDYDSDNKKLKIDANGLTDVVSKQLEQSAKAMGWPGKSGALNVYIDGKAFCLLAKSKVKTTSTQLARQFGLDIAKQLKGREAASLNINGATGYEAGDILEGYASGLYSAGLFKGKVINQGAEKSSQFPSAIGFLGWNKEVSLERSKQYARASLFTRMLQDAPANWLDPIKFAEIGEAIAAELNIKCSIKTKADLEELGAGAFLSVSLGSPIEPRMIVLEIEGEDKSQTVALVGKGLTFDSGGTSLKPSAGMGEMKYDMSGGAAVLGAAHFLGHIKPPTNVVCIIGAVENVGGAAATRPGDIVVALNGKSIDIQNTDAEGRLVLADCLSYCVNTFKPKFVVDIATLTGACLHALGHTGAAMMSNDADIADHLLKSAAAGGEPLWQLPLWPELDKEVKSEIADLCNISKPNVRAGAIVAAVFLKEFIGDTKWAHLDIAGTGWACKATGYPGGGGSAYGMKTMVESCLRYNQ